MPDTRPRASLSGRRVDLAQLAVEVGADLSASDAEVVVVDEDSPVTAAQLRSALNAHAAPPQVDHAADFEAAVKAATTLDALKAAILGTKGPGAEPRRPSAR